MTDQKHYQGYANWATFSVSVWFNNDAPMYNRTQRCVDADELRDLLTNVMSTAHPESPAGHTWWHLHTDGDTPDDIDWNELYNDMRAE